MISILEESWVAWMTPPPIRERKMIPEIMRTGVILWPCLVFLKKWMAMRVTKIMRMSQNQGMVKKRNSENEEVRRGCKSQSAVSKMWRESPKDRLWQNPDKGFLGGRVMEIPGTGQFTLKSPDGQIWQIDFPDFPSSTLMTDQPIRLRGQIMDDGHFSATEFRSKNCPLSSDHRFCQMQPKPFQRLKEFFLPQSIIK